MKAALIQTVLLAALVVAGCGKSDTATTDLQQRADSQEKRLAELEKANRELQAQLQRLEWKYAATGTKTEAAGPAPQVTREELQQAIREVLNEQPGGARPFQPFRAEDQTRWREQAEEAAARQQERQLNRLTEALKLTEDQKEQVKALLAETRERSRKAFEEMRQQGNFNPDAARQLMEDARAKTEEGMKKILSAEQFEQYQKLPERDRMLGGGMRGGPGLPGMPQGAVIVGGEWGAGVGIGPPPPPEGEQRRPAEPPDEQAPR